MGKRKIIVDTNLWISLLIGKRLSALRSLLTNSNFTFYICDALLQEIQNILSKQKIRKYVGIEDISDLFKVIDQYCLTVVITQQTISSGLRDANDLYLLSLADTVEADYILTGDKDLLILQSHNQTKIVTYNDFVRLVL